MAATFTNPPVCRGPTQCHISTLDIKVKIVDIKQLNLFGSDLSADHFENQSNENGFTSWMASALIRLWDCGSWTSFNQAKNRAMTTCNALNTIILENFSQVSVDAGGKTGFDYGLSGFACYLVVMNADDKNPALAHAQAYFAALAGAVHHYMEEANKV